MARSEDLHDFYVSRIDDILERWVAGESFAKICQDEFISYSAFITQLQRNPTLKFRYNAVKEAKALALTDSALDLATVAGRAGAEMNDNSLMRTSIETNMKVASKLDPASWGDKQQLDVSLSGEVKQNLEISPLEAYQRLLRGGTDDA